MKKLIFFLTLFLSGCATPYIPHIEGDCVDRAVAIRQSLKEQGYEARIILGLVNRYDREGHAWVEYKDKETGKWVKVGY